MSEKENPKWSESALLKRRKEVKEDPNLIANGRRRRSSPCLVANGRKRRSSPCLVANGRKMWSSPCLVANGRKRRSFQCLEVNGRRRKSSFPPLFIFHQTNFTQTFIFSFDLKLLLYHGSMLLLMHFPTFPWPINYDRAFQCHKSFLHSLLIWFWLKIIFPFLEIMASHMATSYKPQVTQMNEKLTPKSALDLALM